MSKIKILLHIGRHKTGTTSIQKVLYRNKKLLNKHGYEYPELFFKYPAHHQLSRLFSKEKLRGDELKIKIQEVKKIFLDNFNTKFIYIISSEGFQNVKPRIIRKIFDEKFFDVQVVCYVREQTSYMISSYIQKIHANIVDIKFENYRNNFKADYLKFFDRWSKYFDKINISLFERDELIGRDIVIDFFNKYLGIDLKTYEKIDENPTLTRKLLAFKLIYNKKIINNELITRIKPSKLYFGLGKMSFDDDSGKVLPTMEDVEFIKNKFEESNRLFFEKYLPNKKFKLPGTTVKKEEQFYDMKEEEFDKILEKLKNNGR